MAQLPMLAALADKMRWHQARQTLLAENVANAETPGYRARDLKDFAFEESVRGSALARVTTSTTQPKHIAVSSTGVGGFSTAEKNGYSVSPQGTAVNLEEEMMKITSNQMDYQAATSLYTRSLRMIRTALGRQV